MSVSPVPVSSRVHSESHISSMAGTKQNSSRSLEEPSDMHYGDRRGMVKDEWGNTWQIATRVGDHRDAA